MVQYRRLDPLANAGPYQRLLKSPVKSFTLTEAQFEGVRERRPQLIVSEGEAAVIGLPSRDLLEIHYGFPDVEGFRDRFVDLFNQLVTGSNRAEAPRGVRLSFRDRPNRSLADLVFWSLALDEGPQWVELNLIAVPEQPEPADDLGNGYVVRGASDADRDAIASLEAGVSGQPRLTDAGLTSLQENSRWLRVIEKDGAPVGYIAMHSELSGWGVVDEVILHPEARDALRKPLLDWSIAFLRNNGGRRIRRRVYVYEQADLSLLRDNGFSAAETGLDYTRPVEQAEVQSKIDERQGHGTLIKFGDWR